MLELPVIPENLAEWVANKYGSALLAEILWYPATCLLSGTFDFLTHTPRQEWH